MSSRLEGPPWETCRKSEASWHGFLNIHAPPKGSWSPTVLRSHESPPDISCGPHLADCLYSDSIFFPADPEVGIFLFTEHRAGMADILCSSSISSLHPPQLLLPSPCWAGSFHVFRLRNGNDLGHHPPFLLLPRFFPKLLPPSNRPSSYFHHHQLHLGLHLLAGGA